MKQDEQYNAKEDLGTTKKDLQDTELRALHWLTAPVNDALLHRYFLRQANLSHLGTTELTDDEHRQVVASLNVNPEWQSAWNALEDIYAVEVEWQRLALPTIDPGSDRLALRRGIGAQVLRRRVRYAGMVVVVVLGAYGILWSVGSYGRSEAYELASVEAFRAYYESGMRTGLISTEPSPYMLGLRALFKAPQDWLGLYPHYEAMATETAIAHLQMAYAGTTDKLTQAEVAFFLSKAHLMRGDLLQAKEWLDTVVEMEIVLEDEVFGTEVIRLHERLDTLDVSP